MVAMMPASVSAPSSHRHGYQSDNASQTRRAKTHRHVWCSPQKKANRRSQLEAGPNASLSLEAEA